MSTIALMVNDKAMDVPPGISLHALLEQLAMPLQATAVAVNEEIVSRPSWETTVLSDGDRIALFQAIAGG
ncbi:sulfur carrier protein ThiS [Photobacterium aphoticum]|uniref:Sulfur carrier protein ThiS n=1 Tax=Photobacterium aphoticum TaxID=754436 RepID=A0A0J1JHV5_9GAMM|nr:sulfur carrier protein ThiS [Photobacterium aphoticum]KLV01522.1 hypothetical protein ABT58_07035 [Photobacterium aphoticum]GHA43134.1 thiamine biosynthesis protein ThiS [Photobacterium aphoticum]